MGDNAKARLMTVQDAADMISVSRWTVYRLIWDGHVQSVQIGRSRRVVRASLEAYLAALIEEAA